MTISSHLDNTLKSQKSHPISRLHGLFLGLYILQIILEKNDRVTTALHYKSLQIPLQKIPQGQQGESHSRQHTPTLSTLAECWGSLLNITQAGKSLHLHSVYSDFMGGGKAFRIPCPMTMGIYRILMYSPHKRCVMRVFDVLLVVSLNKLLNIQSSC